MIFYKFECVLGVQRCTRDSSRWGPPDHSLLEGLQVRDGSSRPATRNPPSVQVARAGECCCRPLVGPATDGGKTDEMSTIPILGRKQSKCTILHTCSNRCRSLKTPRLGHLTQLQSDTSPHQCSPDITHIYVRPTSWEII